MNLIEYPFWVWVFFFAVVLIALFVDIGIVNRNSHTPTRKETFAWSAVWVSLALMFNGFVYWMVSNYHGAAVGLYKAKEFFTGYLIELSLSVDNLFVFLLIFNYFKVPKKYQHRVLFWGIFMALVLRMIMIFAGTELVERVHWIIYIFGAFLVYTGVKMLGEDEEFHPEESFFIKLTMRFIRISKKYEGDSFFIRDEHGKLMGTLLLLVLIVINIVDLVFAVDSIPAILGITTDRFIVYTSNIFAILGLRTFFFLLADLADRFHLLKYGLAFILSFIGVKMLLPLLALGLIMVLGENSSGFAVLLQNYLADLNRPYNEQLYASLIVNVSLGIVVLAIVLSIVLSLVFKKDQEEKTEDIID